MFKRNPQISPQLCNVYAIVVQVSPTHFLSLALKCVICSFARDAGGPWGPRAAEGEDPGGGVQRAGRSEHAAAAAVPREPADQ